MSQATGRKRVVGKVVSNQMAQTLVVQVTRLVRHPKYRKVMKRAKKFKVHAPGEKPGVGDEVRSQLVAAGLVRVIDLVFVTKDAEGDVVGIELSDLDESVGAAIRPHVQEPSGMLSDEDIEDLAAELAPNSSAAILLFEHVWATKFRDAVLGSGGELIASIRIPKEVVDEVLAVG